MASGSIEDDFPSKDSEDSNSQDSSVCSKVNEELEHEGYESADSADSNCSVTSGRKFAAGYNEQLMESVVDHQAADAIVSDQISDAGDSSYTSWTDEKHSSYLNSIEATFVRKMYDKEYCSLDVCGRSGHSSVTFEQDCVESHPFYFNQTQKQAGGFAYKGSCRPCFIAPSVLANPWIQHFKSKQPVSLGKERNKVHNLHTSTPASSWNHWLSVQPRLDRNRNTPNARPFHDFQSEMKKRGGSFSLPDHGKLVTHIGGHGTSMQNVLVGGLTKFKKIKCQRMLSEMDMEMEEQFNSQQRVNNCAETNPANEEDHQKMLQANNLSESSKSVDKDVAGIEFLKGKEPIVMEGPANDLLSSMKVDQVVPFLKAGGTEAACRSNMVPEILIESFVSNGNDGSPSNSKQADDLESHRQHIALEQVEADAQIEGENGLGRDSTELESASKRAGCHTWTWGIQGPRRQLSGRTPRIQSKYST